MPSVGVTPQYTCTAQTANAADLLVYFGFPHWTVYLSHVACWLLHSLFFVFGLKKKKKDASSESICSRAVIRKKGCSSHGNADRGGALEGDVGVGPVCFVIEGHVVRGNHAPFPSYHGFNCLELLLWSFTTKWLQRLRRLWEPTKRFMVGDILPFLSAEIWKTNRSCYLPFAQICRIVTYKAQLG